MFTPFMGVGSEVCGALVNGRKGIGVELKPSYYRQAKLNIAHILRSGFGENSSDELRFEESQEDLADGTEVKAEAES